MMGSDQNDSGELNSLTIALCSAIDEFVGFVERHGPYDRDAGSCFRDELGTALSAVQLQNVVNLDTTVGLLAARLGITLPKFFHQDVQSGNRLLPHTGLVIKDWVGEGLPFDVYLNPAPDWAVSLRALKAGIMYVEKLTPKPLRIENKPSWDFDSRKLSFRGITVTYNRNCAPNQWLFLDAFEVSGWKGCIKTPAFGKPPKQDPDKANETIRSLTKKHPHIRFQRRNDKLGAGVDSSNAPGSLRYPACISPQIIWR